MAEEAGIAFSTVHLLEKGDKVREESKEKIVIALSRAGVEIISSGGTGAFLVGVDDASKSAEK
jgi:hypothetical protein